MLRFHTTHSLGLFRILLYFTFSQTLNFAPTLMLELPLPLSCLTKHCVHKAQLIALKNYYKIKQIMQRFFGIYLLKIDLIKSWHVSFQKFQEYCTYIFSLSKLINKSRTIAKYGMYIMQVYILLPLLISIWTYFKNLH